MKEWIETKCEFYSKGECRVLSELVCEVRKCSFYRQKKKGEKDEKKGKQT